MDVALEREFSCDECKDKGELQNEAGDWTSFCECAAGCHAEEKNERQQALAAGELDIGQDDSEEEREYEEKRWKEDEDEYQCWLQWKSEQKECTHTDDAQEHDCCAECTKLWEAKLQKYKEEQKQGRTDRESPKGNDQ